MRGGGVAGGGVNTENKQRAEWEDGGGCSPDAAAQTEEDTWCKQTLVIALDSPGTRVI